MDSGSEITAKIRSAIKAKLVELGAYVDDELPDYIMVMIANKKTKEQMSDDLNLFLGKNSLIFTDWVHGVLDRLQAISQKSVSSVKEKIEGNKKSSSSSHQNSNKHVEKTSSPDKRLSKQDVKENKPKQIGDKRSSKRTYSGKNEDQPKASDVIDDKIKLRDDDVLEMHPEIAGDELDQEITGKSKESSDVIQKSSSQRKRIEAPSSSRKFTRDRPFKRRSFSPDERSTLSNKRRSVVGQVVQKDDRDYDDEEEYDPTRPQLGSVVKVSQRKYQVPVEMQPKPSIFLKALNEANASVSRRKASPTRNQTTSPEFLPKPASTSLSRQKYSKNKKDKETADFSDVEMASDEEYVPEHPKLPLPPASHRDTRRVEFNEPPPPGTTVQESGEELIVDTSKANTSSKPIRFVVTLDGVSSSFVKKVKEKEAVQTTIDGKSANLNGMNLDQVNDEQDTLIVGVEDQLEEQTTNQVNEVKICLDDDEDDDGEPPTTNSSVVAAAGDTISDDGDKMLERCKFWPSCKLGSLCQYTHPSVPCKTFPNCRFGDRCVYIHPPCRYDAFCSNNRCIYAHSTQRRIAPVVQQPIIPKTVVKTVLPLCKFGSRCLNQHCPYKHPKPCLFGLSCSRIDCTFSHPVQPTRPSPPMSDGRKFRWIAPVSKTDTSLAVAAE